MTYVTDQTSAELCVHMRKLKAMPGWHEPLADRLWKEVQDLISERDTLRAALQDKAVEVPKGYVLASETMDVQKLYAQLVDLTLDAGAVDTVIGRPEVLRNNLAALRDEIGAAANGRIPLAAQPAPVVPDGFALVPVEPTPEMWQAVDQFAHAGSVWDAMIAASQQKGWQHG